MKRWKGKCIAGIGVLHTLFGVFLIAPQMGELLEDGIFNTINGQPKREAFLWFLFSGFILIILGQLSDWIEVKQIALPVTLGWGLLIVTILTLILSPLSGGWLILIPSLAIILSKK